MAEQQHRQHRRQIQEQDRISSLPCDILSHTLSFLPTKHAILTSILSKQWRRNWAMVTNLDFNDELMFYPNNRPKDNRKCFSSFVDRVLLYRHNSPIQTFRLQCHLKYHHGELFNWISYAVDHGVRVLDVACFYADGFREDYVQLPQNLFTNQKLEVLKLRSSMNVHVPISILRLPNLRVLHLIKVTGLSDSGIKNLICNCPRLEQLVLIREFYDNLSTLAIISNSLKVFVYREPHMDCEEDECNVLINAPKLYYFDLSHTLSRAFVMSVLPSLVKANIDDVIDALEDSGDGIDIHKNNLVNLFTGISYVRHLSLSSSTMHNLELVSGIAMPTFYYLTHLEVEIGADGWQILPKLLKCSPRLKHFVLHKGNSNDTSMPHLEVNCMSCLETIEMKGFDGSQVDMDAVKIFLENAMVLKKMKICTCKGMKVENIDIERLRRFQRGSKCCELRILILKD